MTDKEFATALLELLNASSFPGAARKKVQEIGEKLEAIEAGDLILSPPTKVKPA